MGRGGTPPWQGLWHTAYSMAPGTRERMVISTALLIREQGARATSIDDVLAHSGAPRGSVYHHFPGGRAQLLAEATAYAGEFVAGYLDGAEGTLALLDRLIGMYTEQLAETDFRAGCPIVAVAVESESDLQEQAAGAFDRWTALLTARLEAEGVATERADELAVLVISSIEGALVMSRARRDSEPLEKVHHGLRAMLAAEIEGGS